MQSLRLNLIIPFIAGILVLTLILSAYTYISSYQAVKKSILTIAEVKTNQTSASISLMFMSVDTQVQNLVDEINVVKLLSNKTDSEAFQKVIDWLNIMIDGNNHYRDMDILDDKGICIASSNPGHMGKSYLNKKYTKLALQGNFNSGEASIGRITKKLSTVTAGPINDHGKIIGVFVVINDLPSLVNYTHTSMYDNADIATTLLTPEGLFETHPDLNIQKNSKFLLPELYNQLKIDSDNGGLVQYSLLGEKYIGYARIEPITKWLIITSGKESVVFAPAYQNGLIVFCISLAIMIIVTYIVIRFANDLLFVLLNLINYAKNISEGNLSIQLKTTERKDELGILQTSLLLLVSSLQNMITETQKISTLKGQFLANMSHEIRTPLNAIIGMTHLALREGNLTIRINGFIKNIQLSARSLLGIINDILDVSKVEAGMIEIESISVNIQELIRNTILIHQVNADIKNINIIFEPTPDVPKYYYGDPLRVGQILNNLLSNALKFTSKGHIIIKCYEGPLPRDYTIPDDALIPVPPNCRCIFISVSDTGIGISEKIIATLFKPFIQADASISRQYGGTGLGLAISNSLVKLMHGRFTVTSVLGVGTTFKFFIQLIPSLDKIDSNNIEENLAISFKNLHLKGKKILVAEDNPINQLIMEELLIPSEATIIIVNNGEEAVNYLKKEHIDLVFMDLQMPIMDGLEATKQIRKFADAKTLPIIAITANAMKEDKERGFACGMNHYITKPIEPQRLVEVLRLFLR